MPQDTPSASPSPGLVTSLAQEIERLTHDLAKRDERIAELERERASYADIEALRRKVTQMEVWQHGHDFLLRHARQNGLQKMHPHEVFRRIAADYCSTHVGEDLRYYRELTELHAHIEDECEQAAEEHDLQRARAAAPRMSLGIGQNGGDIIERGGTKNISLNPYL